MNNYISFSIEETYCIPAGDLYRLDIKTEEENNYTVKWSYIYFITKVPKYRIERILHQGADFLEVLLKKSEREYCGVKAKVEDLFRIGHLIGVLQKQGILETNSKYPVTFQVTSVNSKSIDFIIYIGAAGFTFSVSVYDILINVQMTEGLNEFIKQPEIIYIGKTLKKIKRFMKHSKLQKSLANCADDEEIMIWPTIFRTEFFIEKAQKQGSKIHETTTDLDIDTKKIDLLEFSLIQLFKPVNNEQLKNTTFANANIIKYYRKFDISSIVIQCACHQFFCNFWSPNQQVKNSSVACLHFDFLEVGFSEKLIINRDGKAEFLELDNQVEYSNPRKPIDYFTIDMKIVRNW